MQEYRTHKLKTWPQYYEAVVSNQKLFEVRKNDRDFKVGDFLQLICTSAASGIVEYDDAGNYVNSCMRKIAYILPGGSFGIAPEYCVLGFDLDHISDYHLYDHTCSDN